jgi:hypothetical protein
MLYALLIASVRTTYSVYHIFRYFIILMTKNTNYVVLLYVIVLISFLGSLFYHVFSVIILYSVVDLVINE